MPEKYTRFLVFTLYAPLAAFGSAALEAVRPAGHGPAGPPCSA